MSIKKIYAPWLKSNGFLYFLLIFNYLISDIIYLSLIWMLGMFLNKPSKNIFSINVFGINIILNFIQIIYLIIIILSIYTVTTLLYKHLNFKLSNKGLIYLENEILNNIMRSEYINLCNIDKLEMAQQINNDCVVYSDYIIEKIPALIIQSIKASIILLSVYLISKTTSVMLVVSIAVFVVIYFLFKSKYKKLNINMLNSQMKYFGVLGSELLNVFLVKANSWYSKTAFKFNKVGNEFIYNSVKFLDLDNFISNLLLLFATLMNIIIPLICIKNKITLGSFFIIISLTNVFYPIVKNVFEILKSFSAISNSKDRLESNLRIPKELIGELTLENINTVTLNNIKFKYEDRRDLLSNFSYKFNSGNIVLIKGENGKGKSTLTKLIMGILTVKEGLILINNKPISSFDMNELRKNNISYCEQTPYTIKDTIINNLNYNFSDFKEAYFYKYKLLKFIKDFPEKFNTIINTNANLSGGEKQKISICRCLAKEKASLFIFDEPTSSLDETSKNHFVEEIKKLKCSGKIVILVSHDKKLIEIADDIINL